MRETCARVLAAALMVGAIATVVWMSALAGTPNEPTRPLAAPAAPPPVSVVIRVEPVRPRPKPVRRAPVRVARPSGRVTAGATVVAKPLAAAHPRHVKRPKRHLASTTPTPTTPAPIPQATVEVATPTPTAAPPSDEHGNGHAYGHDKARDKEHEKHKE
ncbi:MAG: hypothetical protein ACJ74D_04750 [Gaiellaceae bacterium]